MNNLKKLLSVLVVVAMIATIALPAFAEGESFTYSAEAQKLNDLGLYKGVSTEAFDPDLGTALNRETGIVMLLRIFGLEAEAQAITDADATLAKFTDAASISSWAKNAVAYAVTNGITQGYPDGTFGPKVALNGKAYATFILRQLGFTPDYNNAPAELADKGGLTGDEATKFADKELIKDDLVGMSYGTLSATNSEDKKVIDILVEKAVVDEAVAIDAGLVTPEATPTPEPVAAALDLDSACALASKVIEVTLATAAKAEDVAAATFKVADTAGKEVAVTTAELAAYGDDKAVLLTLEADTTAGTLYTLTCGTESVKFGGRAAETDKPKVSKVEATDANEVTVTFTEPVKLEGATFTLAEKYGTKAALAVSNMKYSGNTKIVLTVGDMKDATLYGATISGTVDFAGNTMDKDEAQTFVGKAKSTDALKISGNARANDYNEVVVGFNVNVDPATVVPENFTITEKYGTKAAVVVTAARLAKKDDKDTAGNAIASDADGRKYVILSTEGTMKDATLYELKVANLKTLYGVAQSTTDSEKTTTFVGMKKPVDLLVFGATPAVASSNTAVTVSFKYKVDKTIAETIANYSIVEAYGTKAVLAVSKAELQSNGTDVKLTVAAMKNVLYKLTITNIVDIYGNALKTESSYNTVSYAGRDVAAKITKVDNVTRTAPGGSTVTVDGDTQIVVDFDASVSSNATDVSLYSIDNGVGYPTKVQTVDGANNTDKVLLTIGKTKVGTTYKLTVKGLSNADGVAMDSAGVSYSFAGKGTNATLPQIQAVLAVDKQTLKIFFDRDVTGVDIKDKVWDSTTKKIKGTVIQYKKNDGVAVLAPFNTNHQVWQDPDNANVLVVRVNPAIVAAPFDKGNNFTQFTLEGSNTFIDADNDSIVFAYNGSDVAAPELIAATATDKYTVTVYFDQAVTFPDTANNTFAVAEDEAITVNARTVNVIAPIKVDSKTYKFTLDNATALATKTYFIKVANLAKITDKSGYINLKGKDSTTTYKTVQFAGIDTITTDITDVSVMMTDKLTVKVFFPEPMFVNDSSQGGFAKSATKLASYRIFKNSAAAAVGDASAVQPLAVTYNSDDNSATLVLGTEPTDGTNNTYYLGISSAIKNVTDVKNIKNDKTMNTVGTGILVTFAKGTTDNAKPTIKSVTPTSDNTRLTVEFDGPVAINGAPTYVDNGAIALTTDIATVNATDPAAPGIAIANIGNYFTLTAVNANDQAITILDARKTSSSKVVLTLSAPIKTGTTSSLKVVENAANNKIYNINGTQIETGTDKGQKAEFSVAGAMADTTSPTLVSATYLDSNADGAVDKVALKFNEALAATASQTATGADFAWVAGGITNSAIAAAGTGVVVGDTITFTLSTPGNAGITGGGAVPTIAYTDNAARGILDVAGNEVATFAAVNVADGAAPVLVSANATLAVDGVINAGGNEAVADTLVLTFSESVTTTGLALADLAVYVTNDTLGAISADEGLITQAANGATVTISWQDGIANAGAGHTNGTNGVLTIGAGAYASNTLGAGSNSGLGLANSALAKIVEGAGGAGKLTAVHRGGAAGAASGVDVQ